MFIIHVFIFIVFLVSALAMEVGHTQKGKPLLMDTGFTYGIDGVSDKHILY